MSLEHVDVLIVGAGLSGVGAGYHLQQSCPDKSYAILEGRDAIGGTWDLFRYPGIRSDSDMYTLGYPFRPWKGPRAIAEGASIREYVEDTARENGIDKKIRFHHRVTHATWSSRDAKWTLTIARSATQDSVRMTCNFLFMCSGYYSYEAGYTPEFPGIDRFAGRVVHPQKWTSDIDYAGKRVVVIGSGATAITLVPAMAETAAHVTMLQRSPTYIVSLPGEDKMATFMQRVLPITMAYGITRWKNVGLGIFFYWICKNAPELMTKVLLSGVKRNLGEGQRLRPNFTPSYKPWDQRVCLVPDADFFKALNAGRTSVVTDHIETFTEKGITLRSGAQLEADIIVTATGLNMNVLGGLEITVDGERVDFAKKLTYKGMMFNDVPNFASSFGYTNASWTLKCDLTCAYVCRLLNHMRDHGYAQCTPRRNDPSVTEETWLDFSSGYVQRALEKLPKQGSKAPWKVYQNYVLDLLALHYGAVTDPSMEFSKAQG